MKFHSNRRVLKLDIIRPKVHLSQQFIWENVSSYFYEQKRHRWRIPGVQKLVTGRTSCRTTARFTTRVQPCLATNIGCCKSRLYEYWILIGWNYAGVTPYTGATSLAVKQVRIGSVKHAARANFFAERRTTVILFASAFRNLQQPGLLQDRFEWVVKRATLLFNSFCSNVAKQVARFCRPS